MTTLHHLMTPAHLTEADHVIGVVHGLYLLTRGALRLLHPGTGRHRRGRNGGGPAGHGTGRA
ncbi:hypothetical protein [Streptomyces sp. IBSBF 3136]|uniref:hypothetical protein n=1 Tax=Streptomyces sp. IBSBF 3136 TaxID=2903524 RepID=UPI002FDBE835